MCNRNKIFFCTASVFIIMNFCYGMTEKADYRKPVATKEAPQKTFTRKVQETFGIKPQKQAISATEKAKMKVGEIQKEPDALQKTQELSAKETAKRELAEAEVEKARTKAVAAKSSFEEAKTKAEAAKKDAEGGGFLAKIKAGLLGFRKDIADLGELKAQKDFSLAQSKLESKKAKEAEYKSAATSAINIAKDQLLAGNVKGVKALSQAIEILKNPTALDKETMKACLDKAKMQLGEAEKEATDPKQRNTIQQFKISIYLTENIKALEKEQASLEAKQDITESRQGDIDDPITKLRAKISEQKLIVDMVLKTKLDSNTESFTPAALSKKAKDLEADIKKLEKTLARAQQTANKFNSKRGVSSKQMEGLTETPKDADLRKAKEAAQDKVDKIQKRITAKRTELDSLEKLQDFIRELPKIEKDEAGKKKEAKRLISEAQEIKIKEAKIEEKQARQRKIADFMESLGAEKEALEKEAQQDKDFLKYIGATGLTVGDFNKKFGVVHEGINKEFDALNSEKIALKLVEAIQLEKDPNKKHALEILAIKYMQKANAIAKEMAAAHEARMADYPEYKSPGKVLTDAEYSLKFFTEPKPGQQPETFRGATAISDIEFCLRNEKELDSSQRKQLEDTLFKLRIHVLENASKSMVSKNGAAALSEAVEAAKILKSFQEDEGSAGAFKLGEKQKEYLSKYNQLITDELNEKIMETIQKNLALATKSTPAKGSWQSVVISQSQELIKKAEAEAKKETPEATPKKTPEEQAKKKAAEETPKKEAKIETKTEKLEDPPATKREGDKASPIDVVKSVLGIDETELKRLSKEDPEEFKRYLIVEKDAEGREILYLKDPNKQDAPKVRVGNYSEPTGEDLEKRVEARKKKLAGQPRKPFSFSVMYRTTKDGNAHVDAGNMQADPEYKNALFQVASNFSGLETMDREDAAKGDVKDMGSYIWDRTQGPSAALSAAAGTIYRTYFANREKYPNDPSKWPQAVGDEKREVNYLRGFGIETENGYLTYKGAGNIAKLTDSDAKKKFSYGFQEDTQVTHAGIGLDDQHTRFNDPQQKVSQMFVAALNVGQGGDPLADKVKEIITQYVDKETNQFKADTPQAVLDDYNNITKAAQNVLDMSYDATIKEAFARGNDTIVLTKIGGGVFGNRPEWIDAAIQKAIENNKDLLEMAGIKIVLNAYAKAKPENPDAVASEQRMIGLSKQFGGTLTEFGAEKVTTTYPGTTSEAK